MSKSDELRSRLPRLAAEMAYAIEVSLRDLQLAKQSVEPLDAPAAAWLKGIQDTLKLLRPVRDAHEQFRRWMIEVLEQEVDACGLTAEEREMIIGTGLTRDKR